MISDQGNSTRWIHDCFERKNHRRLICTFDVHRGEENCHHGVVGAAYKTITNQKIPMFYKATSHTLSTFHSTHTIIFGI